MSNGNVAPIIVNQLGRTREKEQPREAVRPGLALLGVLLVAVALAGAISAPLVDRHGDVATQVVRCIVVAVFALAGAFALSRRPSERQPILALLPTALAGAATSLSALISANPHGATGATASFLQFARVGEPIALALFPVAVMHFLLGLPDGSCRFSRSAVGIGYLVGAAIGVVLWTRRPALPLWPILIELIVALGIGFAVSQRRYARSAGLERQRMQWFGWATALTLETLLVAIGGRLLWGWPHRPSLVVSVSLIPIAVAIVMAGTRRFATRIDRILAYTVSLAGLTGIVVIVYLIVVLGLASIPTNQSSFSLDKVQDLLHVRLGLAMAAAAIAALIYGPARQRLGQIANRIVYGEREAPDAVLRTFGSRLSRAVPMDELLLQVAESLRKTLALSAAEVWTGSGGHLERAVSVPDVPVKRLTLNDEEQLVVARAGVTGTAWLEVWLPTMLEGREESILRVAPTTHSGQVLGLIVAVRPAGGDQFTTDDDTMLTELARQVGLALHNVELDSALQESLEEVRRQADELRASRARIVAASDAARREIERNLHDGAQQHLVALAVNVRLARKLAETDLESSFELLDQLGLDLQDAVQELRALAHGIYPPLLIDRGLEEALRAAAGRAALETQVEATDLGRYSPETEAAVYFCCMEALQNAGKHAGEGASATVRVWREGDQLAFEVADTGAGFDMKGAAGKGAGFVNMSDRVGAVGGSLRVESGIGTGTTIAGRVPITEPSQPKVAVS